MSKVQRTATKKRTKWNYITALMCLVGVGIDLVMSEVAARLPLPFPLYLDTIGTVACAIMGGFLPGVIVGFVTNILMSISDPSAMYYGILNVLIALTAAWCSRRGWFKRPLGMVGAALVFALIGGGMRALPGELSLASGGVLFLDELPEFRPGILDMLRQALESRKLTISRLSYQEDYPADVLLACAMNPCRCGYYPDLVRCRCTPVQRRSYLGRISGPFLDRIDIGVEVPRQEIPAPGRRTPGESSRAMRERVLAACQIERERFRGENIHFNGEMRARDLDRFCRLDPASEALYREMIRKDELSGRGAEKLLKVARTLADLREKKDIGAEELLTARAFRSFLKTYWGKG